MVKVFTNLLYRIPGADSEGRSDWLAGVRAGRKRTHQMAIPGCATASPGFGPACGRTKQSPAAMALDAPADYDMRLTITGMCA